MLQKRKCIMLIAGLLLVILVVSCGGAEPADEPESAPVEVTRVVTETTVEEVEEPAAEEEMLEEAEPAELEDAAPDDIEAVGSEDATGDGPPPPDTGPKVDATRAPAPTVDPASARAADSDAAAADAGRRPLTPGVVDDNAVWEAYLAFLQTEAAANALPLDGTERHQIWLANQDAPPASVSQLDILFLVDATASMATEISVWQTEMPSIIAQINALPSPPDLRLGLIVYRDQSDEPPVITPLTADGDAFMQDVTAVTAAGGGDYPEDLNTALALAGQQIAWREGETVRLVIVLADAPPHLAGAQLTTLVMGVETAVAQGIIIIPIGSLGLTLSGEAVFRQMAQYSGGRYAYWTPNEAAALSPQTIILPLVTDLLDGSINP